MGKKIADSGGGSFLPTAVLTEQGAEIKGLLKSKRNVSTQYGDKPVYTMAVQEASCKFVRSREEVVPEEGTDVEFFAPTRLERQLVQVSMPEIVRIKNIGKKKVGRGQPAHIFEVEVGE